MAIIELNSTFRNIKYEDKNHLYFSTEGEQLISVTQLINKLKPKFDNSYWPVIKAYQFSGYPTRQVFLKAGGFDPTYFFTGKDKVFVDEDHSHLKVTPEMVKDQWKLDSLVGTTRGTFAHKYLENLESRKIDKPDLTIPYGLDMLETIAFVRSIDVVTRLCDEFVETYTHLIPVAIECIIGDTEMGVAGTFDRLYWNTDSQELEIWDFKTDKKLDTENRYQKLKIFEIDDCGLNKYSVQTSFYKYIIEKNTNLKLGNSYIARLNIKEETIDIHHCADLTKQIADYGNWRNL